ncbi:MAG: SUMF1/EgtB/PvdO family nonheme iron enzyme [Anaerolineaceae bacterium]|nr:SUMF1/EgtB/PvdO family nonheme iron enzyme [Anaerolineaceae bacterium]
MTQLSPDEFAALVKLLSHLDAFRTETSRWRLVDDVLAGTPRENDARSALDLSGAPRQAAVSLLKSFQAWGPGAGDQQDLLNLLAQKLLAGYVFDPEPVAFLQDLCRRPADPETLNQAVQTYTHELRRAVKADLLEKLFVEETGDKQTLAAPIDPAFAGLLDYDLGWLEAMHTASTAEVTGRDRDETDAIDNVRAHLLHHVERGVLLGEPGSGKTWTLLLVLCDAGRGWQVSDETTRIAVLVKLNQFKGLDPATQAPLAFAEFVRRSAGGLAPYLPYLARQKRLLLLCDALNEMPRATADGRDLLAEVTGYLEKLPYFIVSCRYHDYKNDLQTLYPLAQVRLRDLDLPAIRTFISNYSPSEPAAAVLWDKMGGSDDLLEAWKEWDKQTFWDAQADVHRWKKGYDAWRAMHSGARLIPLCRKPYMGFLLTSIYRADGEIPANRSALFGGFVAKLLEREKGNAAKRGQPFPDFAAIIAALTDLAGALQAAQGTTLPAKALPPAIEPRLLDAAEAASLLEFDGTSWRFSHQLLQEYFAARILLAAMEQGQNPAGILDGSWGDNGAKLSPPDPPKGGERGQIPPSGGLGGPAPATNLRPSPWWEPGVWRETAVILGEVADPNEVAIWLAPYSPELARIVLFENAEVQAGHISPSTAARTAIIDEAWAKGAAKDPIERAAAYRVLGHPAIDADRRPGVHVFVRQDGVTLPDIDWVPIPDDGEWIYQDQKHPGLPPFEISRYPITYAQFQTFIDDSEGFKDRRWWDGLADEEYRRSIQNEPGKQTFKFSNHPRERVTWYDAVAFCRWLSWRLGCGYSLYDIVAWAVRLPTELEWEKAARGPDGREYPYAGEFDAMKGNTSATGIGRTSAVGLFPEGTSPYGVEDMSGNVLEWCLTDYRYPVADVAKENIHTRAWRVERGGCWRFNRYDACASCRGFDHSSTDNDSLGFRVCRPPSQ